MSLIANIKMYIMLKNIHFKCFVGGQNFNVHYITIV
jgi:hypothetical protein